MSAFARLDVVAPQARPVQSARGTMRSHLLTFVTLSCVASTALWPAPAGAAEEPQRLGPAGPWEQIQDSEGIVVRRRRVQGSHLHEFQGRAVVDAPLAAVLAVLEDQADHARAPDCGDAAEASVDQSVRTAFIHDRTKAPWPVAERDVVLRADTFVDAAGREVRIDFNTTEIACVPPRPGVVRMPFMRGHYLLRPVNGGKGTDVEYQVHADPGGTLPRWAVHMAERKIPFDTLRGLRHSVNDSSHQPTINNIVTRPEYQALMSTSAAVR